MGEDVSSVCGEFGCTDGQREAGVGGHTASLAPWLPVAVL